MNEPAFPTLRDNGSSPWTQDGMTLRDYFAAAALTGLLDQAGTLRDKVLAKWAYDLADAMLKARESQETRHATRREK